jgi:hypothetical protein
MNSFIIQTKSNCELKEKYLPIRNLKEKHHTNLNLQ